jgi:hypothetical protein
MMPLPLRRKSLADDLAFVEKQLAEHPHPYDTARLMWESRREQLQTEIAQMEGLSGTRAQIALFFDGSPVRGTEEIRLDFATKILDSYQAFISSLAAERAGVELAARGRLPAAFSSKLFIRDMVRGSVGFLLEEPPTAQAELIESSLHNVVEEATRILRDLSVREGGAFEERVAELSPRTIGMIKRMTKIVHDAGAVTRIVGDEEELSLDADNTAVLYARLTEIEIVERQETIKGELLGVFPERQQYEFRPADGSAVFYGPVSDELDQQYFSDSSFARSILLRPVVAHFSVVTTMRAGVPQGEQRVLEKVEIKESYE